MTGNSNRFRRTWPVASAAMCLIVLVIVSLSAAESRPGPARVAYVSMGRILTQSSEAQASARRFQQTREERTKAIAEKQKQLEALRLEGAQLGGVFQASKRAKARADEERTRTELQKLQSDAQAELQKMQHDTQVELQHLLTTVLDGLAKERGVDLVLNQDVAVVWARPGMDWTADAIQRVNAVQAPAQGGQGAQSSQPAPAPQPAK